MDEKEYEVTIREVLEKKVRYRGRNELEATAKAEADYYAEKIVLGADDFSYRDISAKELVPVKEKMCIRDRQEAESYGMTVEAYAANGYEPPKRGGR